MAVRDEVCGMSLTDDQIVATKRFQDNTYHFCSSRCKKHFEEHPGWYVPVRPDSRDESPPVER